MHVFSFSKRLILVRVIVDLELIPGTLTTGRVYSPNGMPVHNKVPCTHTYAQGTYRHVFGWLKNLKEICRKLLGYRVYTHTKTKEKH